MPAGGMLVDMNYLRTGKNAHINILWYEGTDDKFDYFGYVYSMTGSKGYKIPKGQLIIEKTFSYTDDSTKWVLVKEIDDIWSASRLYWRTETWVPDSESMSNGINIKLKPEQ
ncbi:MAG: hypothetical protein GY820_43510 [Gammaproteobacteria bacterium]|nr:hypothetical protein [Gammaproteobacteria bacterium]